jgi:hypothetical protein
MSVRRSEGYPGAVASHGKKIQGMIANLPSKTGKTLDQWVSIVAEAPVGTDGDRAAWLKKEHGLGHFQARLVVTEAKRLHGRNLGGS